MSHTSAGAGDPSVPDDPERHLPPRHNPLPELTDEAPAAVDHADFERVQQSDDFIELRSRFRKFAFPMTAAFLVWYFAYVLLSTYAEGFMKTRVWGNLSIGLLMGIAQFVTTFAITALYIRHANRNLDPLAAKLRDELEGAAR